MELNPFSDVLMPETRKLLITAGNMWTTPPGIHVDIPLLVSPEAAEVGGYACLEHPHAGILTEMSYLVHLETAEHVDTSCFYCGEQDVLILRTVKPTFFEGIHVSNVIEVPEYDVTGLQAVWDGNVFLNFPPYYCNQCFEETANKRRATGNE